MPFGKDLDEEFDEEEGLEETKEDAALVPNSKLNRSERMKKSMRRGGGRDVPSHFAGSDSEDEDEEDAEELASAPKYTQADAKEKTSLTSFIMKEAEMDAARDPEAQRRMEDEFKCELMLTMLSEGVPVKVLVTKYLGDVKKRYINPDLNLEARKAGVSGKTYTVEKFRVLYLLHDQKTLAWRGPVNENEGFASPFKQTRSSVDSYQISHMFKPKFAPTKRYIRLRFRSPEIAKVQYKERIIDIQAKDEDEFDLLAAGFELVWRIHALKLKKEERNPKLLMRKAVARPKTMEEKWEQMGYQPFVFQSLDPDNNIKKIHVGLGRSKEDLLLIGSFMCGFWALLFGLFSILMKASLDSDETNFALWAYFYFLCFFMLFVILAVILSNTNVEQLGLTSTTYIIDSKGNKTLPTKARPPKRTWKEMIMGWAAKLGDWIMFGIVELSIGGPLALAWILLMDNIAVPTYEFFEAKKHKQLYKQFKEDGKRKIKQGKELSAQGVAAGGVLKNKFKAAPGHIKSWGHQSLMSAKAKVKMQSLSKREIRKRQTMNVGVGALHKEERRDRRNRGNAQAELQMNRRKSRRRDSSGSNTYSKNDLQYLREGQRGARETSRSPSPAPLTALSVVPGEREVATL